MAARLNKECEGFEILGNRLRPEYFDIISGQGVLIKDSAISALLAQTIQNPPQNAASVEVTVSVGVKF